MINEQNQIISALIELTQCYLSMNDPDNPMRREIRMWRQRFAENNNVTDRAKNFFMYYPSCSFMDKTPEETLKECIESNDEYR